MDIFSKPIEVKKTDNPDPIYFIPVISYTILVITHFMGMKIPLGVSLAYIGVSAITPSIQLLLVMYGLTTDEWYELRAKGRNTLELFILSLFGLVAITFSAFLLGASSSPFPSANLVFWFITGFVGFVAMNETFMYYYENRAENSAIAFIMSMLVGLAYIMVVSMLA